MNEEKKSCGDCSQFGSQHVGNCLVAGYGTKADNRACDRFNDPPPLTFGEDDKTNEEKKIAQAILDAQRFYKESWRDGACEGIGGHRLNMKECLKTACEKQNLSSNLYTLLDLAMEVKYKDAQDWAKDVLANPLNQS